MAKQKKDGRPLNLLLDRNTFNRLRYYTEDKGQTMTLAIERILNKHFDAEGVPAEVPDTNE